MRRKITELLAVFTIAGLATTITDAVWAEGTTTAVSEHNAGVPYKSSSAAATGSPATNADSSRADANNNDRWKQVKMRGPSNLSGIIPNPPAENSDIPDLGIGPPPSPPSELGLPRGIHIQNDKLASLFVKKSQDQMEQAIKRGDELYHDNSTISSNGLYCAVCHPNAAVTHPETYPKYKQQFDRVVTMQEFINWCIVVPQQGKTQPLGGEVLTAIEAFQAYQNRGLPLEPGYPGP